MMDIIEPLLILENQPARVLRQHQEMLHIDFSIKLPFNCHGTLLEMKELDLIQVTKLKSNYPVALHVLLLLHLIHLSPHRKLP